MAVDTSNLPPNKPHTPYRQPSITTGPRFILFKVDEWDEDGYGVVGGGAVVVYAVVPVEAGGRRLVV